MSHLESKIFGLPCLNCTMDVSLWLLLNVKVKLQVSFVGLYQINIFLISSRKPMLKALLISSHNIRFHDSIRKTRAVGGQRARLLGTFYIVTFLSLSHII